MADIKRVPFGGGNPLDQKMSKAVIHNNTIYLAGTTAEDDVVDRKADIVEQTKSALKSVEDTLKELGSSKDKILSVTVVLPSIPEYFAGMNQVWIPWVGNHKPARTTIEAKLADPNYKIELIVIAAV